MLDETRQLGEFASHKEEADFLRSLVGKKGIEIGPVKVKAVQQLKEPASVKEVGAFPGICQLQTESCVIRLTVTNVSCT